MSKAQRRKNRKRIKEDARKLQEAIQKKETVIPGAAISFYENTKTAINLTLRELENTEILKDSIKNPYTALDTNYRPSLPAADALDNLNIKDTELLLNKQYKFLEDLQPEHDRLAINKQFYSKQLKAIIIAQNLLPVFKQEALKNIELLNATLLNKQKDLEKAQERVAKIERRNTTTYSRRAKTKEEKIAELKAKLAELVNE